jgi:hypothetical protein
MKPKCPRSWLPRVKLARLRFIEASLARALREAEFLASADIGLVRAVTQIMIDVTGKKCIHTHHREDRMVVQTLQPGAEADVQIVRNALRKARGCLIQK